ncbi:TRAP transporter large permease [Shumkonia mesophila]|uniref:TRAP transporter large permease n=1 Tax=Shumkonia mesophila TaxID=2838854 RepID=UPI002935226F|nr:TRAP transporter large permease [Shumkonia mesophila]
MIILILASAWLGLVLVGVPIGIAMIVVSVGYFHIVGAGLSFAVRLMSDGLNSFPLLAVPLFILTATLLNSSGISRRLFDFAKTLVGHVPGGLGHVNILASLFFSGMSGSAMADAGGLGKMEIKAMRDAGYDDKFSGAVTAASSMIGPLVPPSIPMVLYGVIANTSIGDLFLGGVVPGFLTAGALMVMVYVYSLRRNYPVAKRATLRQIMRAFWESIWALLTPAVIIGGIFSGYFSPTEAAGITVLYAILLNLFVYHELSLKKFLADVYETAVTSASVGTIIAGVGLFGYILAREQAPQQIAEFFLGLTSDPLVFLFIVNALMFVLGAFIESLAILLILVPMVAPVAITLGVDPVHFGVVIVLNLMISILTPPMGMSLFMVAKVGNIPMQDLARAILPWLIPPVVVLILITVFPDLVTFLPGLFH